MKGMNFEEFQNYIKDHIGEYLSEDYQDAEMKISHIKKTNGKDYEGLSVSRSGDQDFGIIPVLNLDDAFKKYEKGYGIDSICRELADVRMNTPIPGNITRESFLNFNAIKDQIYPRLMGAKGKEEYLAERPYRQVADMAVVYTVRVQSDAHGMAEAVIDDKLMEVWGVTEDDIHQAAMENLNKQEPVFVNLEDAMFGAFDHGETPKFDPEGIDMDNCSIPFFLLTNQQKVKGAAMALSSKYMDRIVEKFGSIYVLPSSTHEVLIVPKSFMDDPDQLAQMVRQVNEDAVAPEDRLSDNVYEYDPETQTLALASSDPVQGEVQTM